MPKPFAFAIRGPLGAGKTTISKALAKKLGAVVIHIDDVPVVEREWDGGSATLFLKANEGAAEMALPQLSRGISVIFDQNFYWKSVIKDLERRLPVKLKVFSLKVPLETCIERDQKRVPSLGHQAAREVFAKVNRFEYGIPIDATKPLTSVLKEIRGHLRSE